MEEVEYPNALTYPPGQEEEETFPDPFSAEHAPGLSLIVLMRIYDVQMAQFRMNFPEQADKLLALHTEGRILGPLPDYTD